MKRKNVIALILTGVMMASALTGCQKTAGEGRLTGG